MSGEGAHSSAHAARVRLSRTLFLRRLLFGFALLGVGGLLCREVSWFLELRRQGDFIAANAYSGLTEAALCAYLGKLELIFFAAGLAAIATTARSSRRHAPDLGWLVARAAVGLTLFTVAIAVGTVINQSFVLRGHTHFVIRDDAMIALRYSKNVALGRGPVFNAGEHVEGYTGPLWVALFALVHLGNPSLAIAPLLVLVAGYASVVAMVWALEAAMRSFGASAAWIALTGAAVVADYDTVNWALAGLETPGVTAVVVGCVAGLATRRDRLFVVLLALLPLVRSDAAAMAVPLALLFIALATDRKRALRLVLLAAVPAALHLAFRLAYYGVPFPNTYYLKSLSFRDRFITGFGGFGMRVVFLHGAILLGALGALFSTKAPRWLRGAVVVSLIQIGYGISIGGDPFDFARFFAPVFPVVAMACAWTLRRALRGASRTVAVPVVASFGLLFTVFSPTGALGVHFPDPTFPKGSLEAAELLRANVPAGALVTASYAGTTPYYDMEHPFLDVLGKSDAHIAHLHSYVSRAIGHNKFDFDYVYDVRKPPVAMLHHGCGDLDRMPSLSRADIAALAASLPEWVTPFNVYERSHPTFLALYLPNRVQVVGSDDANYFGCFFLREGTDLPLFWSAHGPPPKMAEANIEFGPARLDDRVAFDHTWTPVHTLLDGKMARRTASRGASSVDLWLQDSTDLALSVCTDGAPPADIRVNGAVLTLSDNGDCRNAVVSGGVLASRRSSTRLTVVGARVEVTRIVLRR
jgi:hypothetical protein